MTWQPHNSNERHTVYRAYDADRNLLYVGCTCKSLARIHQQAAVAKWWPLVSFLTVEHAENREAARIIEADAIDREQPRFNRTRLPAGRSLDEVVAVRDVAAEVAAG